MANPQPNEFTKISNELLEALAKIRIAGEARQMLDVIIRKTYGFNKKIDAIPTSQFIKLTNLSRMALHKARKKLLKMNLITITKKGNSQVLNYSIQKDYHKWKLLPKKVTVTKKGNSTVTKKGNQLLPKKVTTSTKETLSKETIQKKGDFAFLKDKEFTKAFNDYLHMRNGIKKPATDNAQELILKKLHKHDIKTAITMLEESVMGSWQGVFVPKPSYNKSQQEDDPELKSAQIRLAKLNNNKKEVSKNG